MLDIDGLSKRFGSKTAVDQASFKADEPTMIGIIGKSGAGKSTLLRMLNRLTSETEGRIILEGRNITALRGAKRRSWYSECTVIFQQFNLVRRMDVVSNGLHGTLNKRMTFATMFNFCTLEDIHTAIEILDRLGISEQAPKRAEALSGGLQQRVAIARALMQAARIILALAAATALSTDAFAQDIEEFRIGILGGENAQNRLNTHSCLGDLTIEVLGVPTRLFAPADYNGVT